MNRARPTSTRELLPSESHFIAIMQQLGYGRFEFLRIECGELVLDPSPSLVRNVKFGTSDPVGPKERAAEFELKKQVAEFFQYVRAVESGEIRTLEVQNGLPFSMEIEHRSDPTRGCQHA
jgi:hypothetical protein